MEGADATQPPLQTESSSLRSPCCQAPYESGGVLEGRGGWGVGFFARWASGEVQEGAFGQVKSADLKLYRVEGRRCTGCGALQLFANRRLY